MEQLLETIQALEEVTAGTLSIHLYDAAIDPYFQGELRKHRHAFCRAIKDRHLQRCLKHCYFETKHSTLQRCESGDPSCGSTLRRCPFGVWQCIVPLRCNGRAIGTLFLSAYRKPLERPPRSVCKTLWQQLTPIESPVLLQRNLRLVELFASWLSQQLSTLPIQIERSRKNTILHFIATHAETGCTLKALARHLHLSVSRTSHAVYEETGQRFRDLLLAYRLQLAERLLAGSGLPIGKVATLCGFGQQAELSRHFKKRYFRTPLQYRQQGNRNTDKLFW